MKEDLTLLVLAAGMGSRFGGLKQIEPVGPNGEFIIDYSIKDAIVAGFNKVVFVIKEDNYEIFKNTIGIRVEDKIKVEYVFQKNTDLPEGINIPKERLKPLGTAHAIYAARNVIHEKFAVINADDLYGRDAYIKAAEFLHNAKNNEYANIAYEIGNKGIILIKKSILLIKINGIITAKPLSGEEKFSIPDNQPVSMNLFCLTPEIFNYLDRHIKEFFNSQKDLMTCEYLLPDVVFASANENNTKIKIVETSSKHYGMTYKEDLDDLKQGILNEINKGTYNNNLWS